MFGKKLKCVWDLGTLHKGKVKKTNIWKNQLSGVPICEKHLEEHKIIMGLTQAGRSIEEVMAAMGEGEEKAKWRQQEYDKLVKEGKINPNQIDL